MKSLTDIRKKIVAILSLAMILFTLLPAGALAATEGVVNTKALVLRKSASKDSKALQTLDKGDKLEIQSSSGDWYKVKAVGYTGYVMKQYVDASGKVQEAETEKKSESDSSSSSSSSDAMRSGDKGSDVKALQKSLKNLGYYKGSIDGIYGSGTEKAVRAFQKKNNLTQDGVAGNKTLSALENGKEADASYKTERLDWFNGGSDIIPKGATFAVKDVKTGKTFSVKRWAGVNHLDGEPASSEDAQTMKDIYGGWSWRRRAILVKYDGHVYAASMNGMPHGTSTINGNGFDGHFCIHFYKSKTHGTDKVDGEHQNMVDSAMNAVW